MTRGREQLRKGASERLRSAKLLCQAHPQPRSFAFFPALGMCHVTFRNTPPRHPPPAREWGRPFPSFPSGPLSPPRRLLGSWVHQHGAQPPTPPQTPPTALPLSPGFHPVLHSLTSCPHVSHLHLHEVWTTLACQPCLHTCGSALLWHLRPWAPTFQGQWAGPWDSPGLCQLGDTADHPAASPLQTAPLLLLISQGHVTLAEASSWGRSTVPGFGRTWWGS